jgi:hypothetical protein
MAKRKLPYVGKTRKVTPAKYAEYRKAAGARYKRATGRPPTPAQISYWTRNFKITKPKVSVTDTALRAIAERMAGKYKRKHGKMPSAEQLRYWTRDFQTKGVVTAEGETIISATEPTEEDKVRFTYVVERTGRTPAK